VNKLHSGHNIKVSTRARWISLCTSQLLLRIMAYNLEQRDSKYKLNVSLAHNLALPHYAYGSPQKLGCWLFHMLRAAAWHKIHI